MPSLQVVTWAKGWHAIDMLKGRTGICVVVCTYSIRRELLSGLVLLSYVSTRTSRSTSYGHRERERQFYTWGLSKQPSSRHPHPSLQDHVSREGHRFPQVGKSLP
jgi:hypothetical protein